jgi:hypothetical protein
VNRIKRPNRFAWERLPRTIGNLRTDPQEMPAGRRRHEVSPPISGFRFRQLIEHNRTEEHTIALDQGQVRRDDHFGCPQNVSDIGP